MFAMKKALILALTGAAAISLAACSENSRTQTEQAADAIAADAKATTQNASDDVEAATARALNSAENTIDRAGDKLDRAGDRAAVQADRAGDNIDRGLDRAGDKIERGADNARQATGNALVRAGEDVRR
ncbi:putative lipoprotein [Sphingomonas sp. S17]|nr:putative lipoprotein [Sphingomonas sp. S17]